MNGMGQKIRCVGVFAPASRTEKSRLEPFLSQMQSEGVRVKLAPHLFAFDDFAYLAAKAEERAQDFQTLYCDPEVDFLLAFRGGYGCVQLLDKLDCAALKKAPRKPVGGYSDLTALHCFLAKEEIGHPVVMPMAGRFCELLKEVKDAPLYRQALPAALGLEKADFAFELVSLARSRKAQGVCMPCNLSVLASLAGTPYLPDFRGRILFLEDVNEPLYRIDRLLTQLTLSGIIEAAEAVVFGEFSGADASELPLLLRRFAASWGKPCLAGFPFGHGTKLFPISFREKAVIDGASLRISAGK